jgi:predicted phosphodiesterase
MRYAIFSDIHGNLEALQQVLAFYREQRVDRWVCLGDLVGYGPKPQACVDLVRSLPGIRVVVGNHDAAVSGKMDYAYYYDAARTALDHHRALLDEPTRAWLRALPFEAREGDVCFTHGSPVNPEAFDYVFNMAQAQSLCVHWSSLARVSFMGHSHLTRSYELGAGGLPEDIREMETDRLELRAGCRYVVTVGSVGQPRDNDARACCVIYDSDTEVIEWHRLLYPLEATAGSIFLDERLSADFGKRLFLGI